MNDDFTIINTNSSSSSADMNITDETLKKSNKSNKNHSINALIKKKNKINVTTTDETLEVDYT